MADVPEVKTALTSPVPPKFIEIKPEQPKEVQVGVNYMSWGQAMNQLIQGRKIKRESWPIGFDLELINDEMTLRKPDNSLSTMIIHKVDLLATDWITV